MKMRRTILGLSLLLLLSGCKTNPPNAPDNAIELGKAFISANVSDAVIWLDGNNTGKFTPDTIEARAGLHEISLTKDLYYESTQSVEIIKDSILQLTFTMEEILDIGSVFVTSNVVGAAILLDNEDTGKLTPDTISASSGAHQILLRAAFYNDGFQDVIVIRDSLIEVDVTLEEEPFKTTVLLEDFANVSCIPCVTSNKIIESLTKYTYGYDQLVAIKYPTNFPSPNDPFYLANSEDCDARMGYYNILFAPTTIIDGIERPISTDSLSIKSAIDLRLQKNARFRIHVSDNIIGSIYYITITVRVEDGSGVDFSNLVLHTVVTETDIVFSTPPGSNGETEFFDVMRKMLPSNVGESISMLEQTEEKTFQRQVNIDPSWNVNHLNIVVFIQDNITGEVYQAGSTF